MARRGPPWRLIGSVFTVVTVAAMSAAFWTGGANPAPKDSEICWRMTMEGDKPRFHRLAGGVLNLETCAAYLERLFLQSGGEIVGAYQGRYIFIDSQAIRSAATLDGSRWRIFYDPQRADLDRRLQQGTGTPTVAMMPAS